MQILLVGVSYRTAPIEMRERIDFSTRLKPALQALAARPASREAVVLSTCNRAELYVACESPERAKADLVAFMSAFHGVPAAELSPHLYDQLDADAVRHLFRVASGLDSLVVGEPQILGQVKEAFATAAEEQVAGPLLTRLFHSSFAVGKRVRSETGLAEGAVSVSYAAVSLARKIFGDLKGRRVLVIGAGEMGKLTALHLKSQGIREIVITSRTAAHASALVDQIDGAVGVPWEALPAALTEADIVVTATGSATPILDRAQVAGAMGPHRNRPLFIIDIALPRDVDPTTGSLEQVFLYNIDDLQAIVQENLSRRSGEVTSAETIVDEEVGRFAAWLRARSAVPTVVALRQRFEAIRRSELQRLEPKLAGLPPDARARVDEITRLLVEKLLIGPTEQLKALPDSETMTLYADAVSHLFDLDHDGAGAATPPDEAGDPADRHRARRYPGRSRAFPGADDE
ncbi:MAG TPA: glutamyl-tRNA reductase [Vicinamibacterales bacterium]|nr:glutamyl-tRNA reductase [Vicinamibacterales bacterium]